MRCITVMVVLVGLGVCGGCGSVVSRDDFLRGGDALPAFKLQPVGLQHLTAQVRGETMPATPPVTRALTTGGPAVSIQYVPEVHALSKGTGIALENDPVLLKLTEALKPEQDGGPRKVRISLWEFKNFTEKVARGLGSFDSSEQLLADVDASLVQAGGSGGDAKVAGFKSTANVRLSAMLAAYLKEYLRGKFVDRAGNELPKPKLGKTIGNDTIVGFETVILEACFDYAYLTPALYEEGDMEYEEAYVGPLNADLGVGVTPPAGGATTYKVKLDGADAVFVRLFKQTGKPKIFNKEKKKPTFVKVRADLIAPLSTDSHKGVTALERETIDFISDLSSQGSQQLSGLIARLFGGIHVGFGILGKVSVGDNDTIAKSVETFTEVSSRRYLEARAFDAFDKFVYSEVPDANGKVVDVRLEPADRVANKNAGIDEKQGDALILLLRVQLKLHGLLS